MGQDRPEVGWCLQPMEARTPGLGQECLPVGAEGPSGQARGCWLSLLQLPNQEREIKDPQGTSCWPCASRMDRRAAMPPGAESFRSLSPF